MDERTKVLVVGGGVIGQAVWQGLNQLIDYEVQVIDADPNHPWKNLDWLLHAEDFFENTEDYLDKLGPDYLVMAVPIYDPEIIRKVASTCSSMGVHYVDFSEDVHVREVLEQMTPDVAFMPGCGIAPGMIQVLAQNLTKPFDKVLDIEMNVGSLPLFTSNRLGYHVMWSVVGVVNEYTNPVTTIDDYMVAVHNPLEYCYPVTANGVEHEAFSTSGGLGTMINTWAGKARNVSYRTIRYSGHLNEVYRILGLPSFGAMFRSRTMIPKDEYDLEKLRKALSETLTVRPVEDRVIIHVVVRGLIDGELRENIYSKDIRWTRNSGFISAIQRTTAGGAIAVIEAHRKMKDKPIGVIKQEDMVDAILEQTHILHWAGYYGGS